MCVENSLHTVINLKDFFFVPQKLPKHFLVFRWPQHLDLGKMLSYKEILPKQYQLHHSIQDPCTWIHQDQLQNCHQRQLFWLDHQEIQNQLSSSVQHGRCSHQLPENVALWKFLYGKKIYIMKWIPQLGFEFPMKYDKRKSEDGLPRHQDNLSHRWCQHWKCRHNESVEEISHF